MRVRRPGVLIEAADDRTVALFRLAPQAPDPPNWFSVFKRPNHQRRDCQSVCFHFQIQRSLLFITDKQTF